jgi:hypothetical protein
VVNLDKEKYIESECIVCSRYRRCMLLVPSLWGLQVVQGLREVPVFVYRYSTKVSLKKARSPGTTEGGRSD